MKRSVLDNDTKITDTAALERAGISPTEAARLLNDVCAEQIFRLGWLHADPHPGNLLVQATAEGRPRLAVLDHGLTVPLKPELVDALAEMVSALGANDFARLNYALAKAQVRLDADLDIATSLQLVGVLMGSASDGGGAVSIGAFVRQLGKASTTFPPT
jgi:hypothetical protein